MGPRWNGKRGYIEKTEVTSGAGLEHYLPYGWIKVYKDKYQDYFLVKLTDDINKAYDFAVRQQHYLLYLEELERKGYIEQVDKKLQESIKSYNRMFLKQDLVW